MDYRKNYNDLINSRKKLNRTKFDKVKYELHHILPRSLGGLDTEENLVLLTFREHFLAHYLLYKIYHNKQMISAYFIMFTKNGEIKNSKQYERIRKEYIESISKKVVRLEDAKIYNSRTEAAIDNGLTEYTADIAKCIDLDNKTAGGYHWGTFIENIDYTKNKWYNFFEEKYSLIRLEDLKKYKTWKEAADDICCTVGAIGYSVNSGGGAKGWHFLKYDCFTDYLANPYYGKKPGTKKIDLSSKYKQKKQTKHYCKIICVETGEIFNTQKEACDKYKVLSSGISRAIKNKGVCGGKHWKIIEDC